jgi:protein-S-isoprenylcysteine O-methyltransferase Ste14
MDLKWVYRWRGPLAACPLIFSTWCFFGEYENDLVIWPLGMITFLAGWFLRMWAQQHLGYRLRIKKVFTCSGPYTLVRNPIYIGNTLVILGVVTMSEVFWTIPLSLLWCLVLYSLVVRYEERVLTGKYGQTYLSYVGEVWRWRPRFAQPTRKMGWHIPLLHAMRAEIPVAFILAAPLVKEHILARFFE